RNRLPTRAKRSGPSVARKRTALRPVELERPAVPSVSRTVLAVGAAESTMRTPCPTTERIACTSIGKCVHPRTSLSGADAFPRPRVHFAALRHRRRRMKQRFEVVPRDRLRDRPFVQSFFSQRDEHLRRPRAHHRIGPSPLDRILICTTAYRTFRGDDADVPAL